MYINSNISSVNTQRNLRINSELKAKTMEKLSSGYRINRAADDSAGLAISEKMKYQINGLQQGARNIQDGISLVQTADGVLSSVTDALQRIGQLIVQRENGTYQNSDKETINKEVVQLLDHIEQITSSTQFNGINLFDGSFTNKSIYANGDIPISISNMDLGLYYKENFNEPNKFNQWEADAGQWSIENGELVQSLSGIGDKTILSKVVYDNEMTITVDAKFTTADSDGNIGIIIKGEDFNNQVFAWYSQYGGMYLGERVNGVYRNIGLIAADAAKVDEVYKLKATVVGDYYTFSVDGVGRIEGYSNNARLQEGYTGVFTAFAEASFDNYQVVPYISIGDIEEALNKVASERAKLGVYQNRLEHTLNNVLNNAENLSAAHSRIRDADMALEMTTLTKAQILMEAGQAMLAQANTSTQIILKLLNQ